MKSFWAARWRGFIGKFRRPNAEHLHGHANEFAGRHNFRSLDTERQIANIIFGMDS